MLKRIPNSIYSTLFSTVYLALGVNALLVLTCAPFLIVLITTDPSLSWPLLAVTAALCAPGFAAAFAVFREHKDGEPGVVRPFGRALRATWKKALAVGILTSAVLVVAVADVLVLAPMRFGMVIVPLLAVLGVVALVTGVTVLVAISEAPNARLRDALRASLVLGVRSWPLSVLALVVIGTQAGIAVASPAIGIGVTASACLYVVWAGARRTLQPALVPASEAETPVTRDARRASSAHRADVQAVAA